MRISSLLLTFGLALFATLGLSAQTVRVVFVSGQAEIQRPDEAAPRAITKGETVVVGTRITTGPDGRVALTPMPGVNSIVAPNTTLVLESVAETRTSATEVTHQAVLDLKEGTIVSDLNRPEGVTYDYSIRTARGLAGARGTTYTVGVNAAGIQTIVVSSGTIVINFLDGSQATLSTGGLSFTDASGATREVTSAADLSPEEKAVVQSVTEAALTALAEAIEAGVEISPATLQEALDAANSLGVALSPELKALINRLITLATPPAPPGNDVDSETIKNVVTEQEPETDDSEAPITGFPSLEAFFLSLTTERQSAFSEILDLGFNTDGEALLTARLQDGQFADDIVKVIDLYMEMISNEIDPDILVQLGILGDNNIAAVGADSEGLLSLISAYQNLSFFQEGGFFALKGNESELKSPGGNATHFMGRHTFFPGNNPAAGQTIYNVVFGEIDDSLTTVGATRVLSINNEGLGEDDTFVGGYTFGEGNTFGRVELRAADLVSLNHTRFGPNITDVIIAAATINLANLTFNEGSVVQLYSKLGSANFGSSVFGKVNFITNVKYGETTLTSENFGDGVRGESDVTGGRVTIDTLASIRDYNGGSGFDGPSE